MTDILLGGNFSLFYTGHYESTDQLGEQEFTASSNFLFSSVKANVKYDESLFKSFKQVNIYIKTQGGTVNSNAIISQNSNGNLDNVSVDYAGWMNSVTLKSESLIGVGNPDTQMHLISELIEDPIIRHDIEAFLLSLSSQEIALCSKHNNASLNSALLVALKDNNSPTMFKGQLFPTGPAFVVEAAIVKFIKKDGYYRITPTKNRIKQYYLNESGNYTSLKNDNTQLWKLYVSKNNNSEFMLQNVSNNLYLSSYDLKFYKKPSINEESNFYWSIGYSNIHGITY